MCSNANESSLYKLNTSRRKRLLNYTSFVLVSLVALVGIQKVDCIPSSSFKFNDTIAYPHSFEYKGNPLVTHISAADPDVNVWDGIVYMYCSQDHQRGLNAIGNYDTMDGYHVFTSGDMIHWIDHGEILSSQNLTWGRSGFMWAPGAARKDGTYYLYYPHLDYDNVWKIGVATSDSPLGPFTDTSVPMDGVHGIDPKVFVDDDGEAYMYYNSARVVKLQPNMIQIAEEPRKVDYGALSIRQNQFTKFYEGSYMHKRNGIYYYSYSNVNPGYQGYYAMGNSPYGPFEWVGPFVREPYMAQNHHSIIEFNGESYFFYHMNTPGVYRKEAGYEGARRVACYEKFYYNDDGTMHMIQHTFAEDTAK